MFNLNIFKIEYDWRKPDNWGIIISDFFRNIKYAWQRATKGYSDKDLQCFDVYLTQLLSNAITEFSYSSIGTPTGMDRHQWEEEMIKMARLFADAHPYNKDFYSAKELRAATEHCKQSKDKAFKMLSHYFYCLWE